MDNLEVMFDKWLAEHKQEMLDELALWVAHPSVSRADLAAPGAPYGPDCRKMLDFALERGRHYGFEVNDYEGYCCDIHYGPQDHEIGFVGHLDVVPEGDGWIYEPYKMNQHGEFLIGRGVGDDKGPTVMCLFLMRFFKENNITLKHGLRLMMGCAEETGMADYRHYMEHNMGPVPEVSIVADSGFPVCYAQKGSFNAAFKIPAGKNIVSFTGGTVRNAIPDAATLTVSGVSLADAQRILAGADRVSVEADGENVKIIGHGKAGHAAMPDPQVMNSAIVLCARAAAALEQEAGIDLTGCKCIAETFPTAFGQGLGIDFEDEMSGKLTINAGVVRKEGEHLFLDIDIRFPVSDTIEAIDAAMRARLAQFGAELVDIDTAKPYYIDPNDKKVLALMSAYRDITGDETPAFTMGGGTYSRVVPNAMSFGPGFMKGGHHQDFLPEGHGNAHGRDETMHIGDWLTAIKIYVLSVARLDEAMSE